MESRPKKLLDQVRTPSESSITPAAPNNRAASQNFFDEVLAGFFV
jgi:hypothetical protein